MKSTGRGAAAVYVVFAAVFAAVWIGIGVSIASHIGFIGVIMLPLGLLPLVMAIVQLVRSKQQPERMGDKAVIDETLARAAKCVAPEREETERPEVRCAYCGVMIEVEEGVFCPHCGAPR
ncbi:MAG: hypothetical protein Q4B99_02975 [Clostridia bacterium]|nr:hypothetical protein [Clostridia bacterium]